MKCVLSGLFSILFCMALVGTAAPEETGTLKERNEALFRRLQRVHHLTDAQMAKIREIFSKSGYIGQGNPAVTRHPATPEQ
jgi:hypothetical protein